MTTTLEIITESLRLLRVIGSNEAPDDDDARDSLSALNRMVRRWEANGMALGWSTVDSVNDELPAPEEAEEPIIYNLARRLQTQFGKQLDGEALNTAREGLNALRRDVAVANPLTMEGGPYAWGRYTIRSDSYDY